MSAHACKYCQARLVQDNAVWVDSTASNICLGDWITGANENQQHQAVVLPEYTLRLDSLAVDHLFTILDEYEEMALGSWDEDSEDPDEYPEDRNGVRVLRAALLTRES